MRLKLIAGNVKTGAPPAAATPAAAPPYPKVNKPIPSCPSNRTNRIVGSSCYLATRQPYRRW